MFKLSDDGKIRGIDTVVPNKDGGGLFREASANTVTYGSSFIGPEIVTDASTIVFIIPTSETEKGDVTAYKVTNSSAFKTWSNNNVLSYRSANENEPGKAEIVILYRNLLTDSSTDDGIFVVTNVSQIWDEDTNTIRDKVEVMEGKALKG